MPADHAIAILVSRPEEAMRPELRPPLTFARHRIIAQMLDDQPPTRAHVGMLLAGRTNHRPGSAGSRPAAQQPQYPSTILASAETDPPPRSTKTANRTALILIRVPRHRIIINEMPDDLNLLYKLPDTEPDHDDANTETQHEEGQDAHRAEKGA